MPLHWKTISDTERTDPMNKTELIEIVSKNAELTKKESAAAVDALLDGIVEGLRPCPHGEGRQQNHQEQSFD